MAVSVEIKGEGTVKQEAVENAVLLTAVPDEEWMFKHFQIGGETFKDNPYTAQPEVNVEVIFYYPIESHLKGKFGFEVPNYVLTSVRKDRGIAKNADVDELTERQIELAYADILVWASTNPTTYVGSKDSDGGWSHQESSQTLTVTDKKRFSDMANEIYKKWGDGKYSANIKIVNLI